MIPSYIRGSIAPVFTAFNEDGSLDNDGQRSILTYLAETKAVSAFFVRSGMGQMFTFSLDEVKQIAKTSCDLKAGKVPVVVGCAGIWDRNRDKYPYPEVYTRQAIELSQYAESVGADGVVHTVPEALAGQSGLSPADATLAYFEKVCAAVKIPVLIYQSPGTDPDFVMSPALVAKLADMDNIKGMKASTSDAAYIFDVTYAVRDKDFGYIVGAEYAFLAGLLTGAKAVIGQGATVNPKILTAIQTRFEAGDIAGAIEAQYSTNLLVYRSKETVRFYKRYINEKGYKVKPFGREGAALYASAAGGGLTEEQYESYKQLLESELAKY